MSRTFKQMPEFGSKIALTLVVLRSMEESYPTKKEFTLSDLQKGFKSYTGKNSMYSPGSISKALSVLAWKDYIELDRNSDDQLVIKLLDTVHTKSASDEFGSWSFSTDVSASHKFTDKDKEEEQHLFSEMPKLRKSLGIRPGSTGHTMLWEMRSLGAKYKSKTYHSDSDMYKVKTAQKLAIMGLVEPKDVDDGTTFQVSITKKGKSMVDKLNVGKSVKVPSTKFNKEVLEKWPDWAPYDFYKGLRGE